MSKGEKISMPGIIWFPAVDRSIYYCIYMCTNYCVIYITMSLIRMQCCTATLLQIFTPMYNCKKEVSPFRFQFVAIKNKLKVMVTSCSGLARAILIVWDNKKKIYHEDLRNNLKIFIGDKWNRDGLQTYMLLQWWNTVIYWKW